MVLNKLGSFQRSILVRLDMLDVEGGVGAEELVVRVATSLALVDALRLERSPVDRLQLFEHVLAGEAIALGLLEEEGPVVETLEEVPLSDRPPRRQFLLLLTLHLGYLLCEPLEDVLNQLHWLLLDVDLDLARQAFRDVVLVPPNDECVVGIPQVLRLVARHSAVWNEARSVLFLPFFGVLELLSQLGDHVLELQDPMVGLVHLVLVLEELVFRLVFHLEAVVFLAGGDAAIAVVQCLFALLREVPP